MNPDLVEVMTTACYVWRGGVQTRGYGSTGDGQGGTKLAHRAAWEQEHGPIPDGLTVDHLCGNKLCVNTDHMELVTRAENLSRRGTRQRACVRGHVFTPQTTWRNGKGFRYCRTCATEARRSKAGAA